MKKLMIFGLVGLVTLLYALTILAPATNNPIPPEPTEGREKMKVVCWDPHAYQGDNSHWRNFRQIDSCFMNTMDVTTYTQADFDSNQHYQFKLIEALDWGAPIVVGQKSIYEADNHYYRARPIPPGFNGYFEHSNLVGREKDDNDALNGFTWYATPDSDQAGYIMRDLKGEYNYEQWDPQGCCSGPTTTFYADFRIKISNNSYQANPFLILKAKRIYQGNTFLLDSLVVRPQNFTYPNQYQTFELTFTRADTDSGYLDYTVWWNGSRAVWLDRVEIRDAYADSLFRGLYNQRIQTLKQQRGAYLWGWYLVDEPQPDQFATQAYLVALLDSLQAPKAVQAYPLVDKMDEYLSVVNPRELWFDNYPIEWGMDSATTGGVLQTKLNSLTAALYQAKQKAISLGKPFIYIAQAYQEQPWIRYPTKFEQKMLAWLGLAYGANGIAYFTYATRDGIRGLVDRNPVTGYYEPHEPNWSVVRGVNAIIDSIGWLFVDTSSWQGAGQGDTVNLIHGSFISHLKTAEFTSPWIEVGFFKDTVNTNYFMLVNRRCLSTEAQNVTIYLDSAKIGNKKMWYVIDQYSRDTTFTGAINGDIPFTTHLDPGEGKLFKLVPFAGSVFHGTAHPFTWQGGIMIDGDVTVASGKTLVIQPPAKIAFFANKDTLHTWDPADCDFIINGGLRAVGNETDSIIFTSTGNSPDDWEGIRVRPSATGSTQLSHCVLEYSYWGIELCDSVFANPDSIHNSKFVDNALAGIIVENDLARIENNLVSYDSLILAYGMFGIYIKRINSGAISIATNNVIENYYEGIAIVQSSTKISENVISTTKPDAWGIRASSCDDVTIDRTSVIGDSLSIQ